MVKKSDKSDKDIKSPKKKKMSRTEMDEALISNFISLQKVLTNLSTKFEDLSDKISKLLQLFEISAKSFGEKLPDPKEPEVDKEFLKKLDNLLDQNKTISKGILLMEERIRNKSQRAENAEDRFRDAYNSKPLPRF